MKILIVHNAYQQRGGEDIVVESEISLLRSHGHRVETYLRSNDDIKNLSQFSIAIQTLWSLRTSREITDLIKDFRPDVIHVHNTLPLISPSIYWEATRLRIPVLQTLHNFRLICLQAMLLRKNRVCEDCLCCSPLRGVVRGCYRNSRMQSAVLGLMLILHRTLGTFTNKVSRFIALTEFGALKFVEAGFSKRKIVVKPNFFSGKGIANDMALEQGRLGVLFVGRISAEKGIRTLVNAWEKIDMPLRVVGDGPLFSEVQDACIKKINCLGSMTAEQVSVEMTQANFLVMPSEWYETFGLVIIEAFAHGLPVIVSRLGAMAEIVADGVTGLHVEPGNAEDLVTKVRWMAEHPEECRQMGYNARREFEAKYTPERNYEMLMKIYQEAIDEKK